MDSQSTTVESKPRHRQSNPWSKASSAASTPRVSPATQLESPPAHFASPLDLLPILSQQSSLYQAQLLQYNKLISPDRGGGGVGPQTSPHVSAASPTHFQTTLRSRSSSKVSNKDSSSSRPGAQNCHGNKPAKNLPDSADRASITPPEKELPQPKMTGKNAADRNPPPAHQLPARPPQTTRSAPPVAAGDHAALSSSVPSTPHQRARQFSFGSRSREPSPGATHNHSPRSAYSETNSTLPSLRPLPPRLGGCRFETMPAYGRRRMNYSIGDEKLERADLDKIKSKLSEDDERKLTTDMRELYDRLLPTESIGNNRHKLVQKLEKLFNDEWPGHDIRVHLFGSSGNMLCSDDSDVDICITTEWTELESVCMIADLLARHGMEKVVCVSQAKVPIVKIWDPELGLACDMNVNNTVALENTRMVRTYVQVDERVRPLAMIIKYWTRKRIVNDAAFGGTLSSYTWICMIIAFLQLRDPPVLPPLHQRHQEKLTDKQGHKSDFADDVEKLRGFGGKNKDSLGALLFQFFRFYAHEFDYDKYALSVRLGKLITKSEKKWHLAQNNRLCVEEPFNTSRNLGNTADDYSFRGLHLELRRAFDLIAEGNLEKCCEQYEFPEEEPRTIFQKPAAAPRPILVRSSSQHNSTSTRGGRGGYRGGGGRQFHRNGGNNSRRASSVASYDNNAPFSPAAAQSQMTPQEAQLLWYQAQQPQLAMHQDIFGTTMNALQAQENSLRFHLYTQQQAMQTQQALAVAQRMQSGGSTQSADRSRTNSFDNPPLTAPIRPDMQYIYPYPMQPYYPHPGFTTYPSSPSTSTSATATEYRRSLHRSTITSESGLSTGSGSLRSQSQPATRTSLPPGAQGTAGYPTASQGPTSVPSFPLRQLNGMTISSFIPDERLVPDYSNETIKPLSHSPPEDDGPRYVGFYVNEVPNPIPNPINSIQSLNGASNGMSSFGDAGHSSQGRRRLSTDQMPQSILDRRMRRTSRSPSPLGHTRAFSVGTSSAPLASNPFPQTASKLGPSRPLVVNGTALPVKSAPATAIPSQQPSGTGSLTLDESSYDNPLRINQHHGLGMSWPDQVLGQPPQGFTEQSSPPDRPVVVNGTMSGPAPSSAAQQPLMDSPSFNQRMAQFSTLNINAPPYTYMNGDSSNGLLRQAQNGRSRVISRQQQNGIAPLDLATGDFMVNQDLQHLSPVYEHRTPSPTFMRKYETPQARVEKAAATGASKLATARDASGSLPPKPPTQKSHMSKTPPLKETSTSSPTATSRANGFARENGHGHGSRKEGDHPTGWQKQKSKKKAGVADLKTAAAGFTQVEQLPKNDADRKGG
ncbi:hypothetical protein CONLIGDRAFT_700459 [Coniochaeta ligniaria NRRL 30616]|uniref:polynucleotide adenylyltransferase n=1 Tax=Coniochaeta ligniaria NRRL 30616 TaxID=1408157 RepID=A0A1J7IU45_9PEZI|nr:hypothetical protein CONLIGDRAFT_700459 [Coniochaeta ligniaria NRRL 30616]